MRWSYGITTVPHRYDLFLRTLASLKGAGFDKPRIFVDGECNHDCYDKLGLEVTYRNPTIRTTGNWWLGLLELYLRTAASDPAIGEGPAKRYAMFQDDFICCRNLREYLELTTLHEKAYWNLYLFPENDRQPQSKDGWFESNQLGKGAVGLVFTMLGVQTLLMSYHWVHRPMDYRRGFRAIDGGIVDSFRKAGWKELVHRPSLLQHTGETTSIETVSGDRPHPKQPLANTFPGEAFDLLTLQIPKIDTQTYNDDTAWEAEKNALEAAIRDDMERIKQTNNRADIQRLRGHIARYQRELGLHRGKKPCNSATP